MVLDLNRILVYGDAHGAVHDAPQRKIFSLTDGIVAWDRNGPLAPEPLGVVTFTSNAAHQTPPPWLSWGLTSNVSPW